jgi:hypothetical protein
MQRYLKTTLASAFAVSLLAGGAYAQTDPSMNSGDKGPSIEEKQQMVDPNSTGSIGTGNLLTEQEITGWQSGKVNVVVLGELNENDPTRTAFEGRMKENPDEVAALQSAIQNNAALKAELDNQNVQLNNVVAAQKAADGSVTLYVQ